MNQRTLIAPQRFLGLLLILCGHGYSMNNSGFFLEGIGGYGQSSQMLWLQNNSSLKLQNSGELAGTNLKTFDQINAGADDIGWQADISGGYRFISAPFIITLTAGTNFNVDSEQFKSQLGKQFGLYAAATPATVSSTLDSVTATPGADNPLAATVSTTGTSPNKKISVTVTDPATTPSSANSAMTVSPVFNMTSAIDLEMTSTTGGTTTNNYGNSNKGILSELGFNTQSNVWLNVEMAYALSQRMSIGGMIGTDYREGDVSYEFINSLQLADPSKIIDDLRVRMQRQRYQLLRLGTIVEYNINKNLSLVERFVYTSGIDRLPSSETTNTSFSSITQRKVVSSEASAHIGLRWYIFS